MSQYSTHRSMRKQSRRKHSCRRMQQAYLKSGGLSVTHMQLLLLILILRATAIAALVTGAVRDPIGALQLW